MTVRSITAARLPAFAAAMAAFCPAGPLPITIRSYADALTLRASNPRCQVHWSFPLWEVRAHFCFHGCSRHPDIATAVPKWTNRRSGGSTLYCSAGYGEGADLVG